MAMLQLSSPPPTFWRHNVIEAVIIHSYHKLYIKTIMPSLFFINKTQICYFNSFSILNTSYCNKTKVPAIVIYSKRPRQCMLTVKLPTSVWRLFCLTLLCLFYCANTCMKTKLKDTLSILCFMNMCFRF